MKLKTEKCNYCKAEKTISTIAAIKKNKYKGVTTGDATR
jgi:hypothetical protein